MTVLVSRLRTICESTEFRIGTRNYRQSGIQCSAPPTVLKPDGIRIESSDKASQDRSEVKHLRHRSRHTKPLYAAHLLPKIHECTPVTGRVRDRQNRLPYGEHNQPCLPPRPNDQPSQINWRTSIWISLPELYLMIVAPAVHLRSASKTSLQIHSPAKMLRQHLHREWNRCTDILFFLKHSGRSDHADRS